MSSDQKDPEDNAEEEIKNELKVLLTHKVGETITEAVEQFSGTAHGKSMAIRNVRDFMIKIEDAHRQRFKVVMSSLLFGFLAMLVVLGMLQYYWANFEGREAKDIAEEAKLIARNAYAMAGDNSNVRKIESELVEIIDAHRKFINKTGKRYRDFSANQVNKVSYVIYMKELQGLDRFQAYATVGSESLWKINATSGKGARGLMQLMEETADELVANDWYLKSVDYDLYDPPINVDLGCRYLLQLNSIGKKYHNKKANGWDYLDTGGCYNWGPGDYKSYINKRYNGIRAGMPAETRIYLTKLQFYYTNYTAEIPNFRAVWTNDT